MINYFEVLFVNSVKLECHYSRRRNISALPASVADPHHLDADHDPDPDPAFHFDADPDPGSGSFCQLGIVKKKF